MMKDVLTRALISAIDDAAAASNPHVRRRCQGMTNQAPGGVM